MKTRKPTLRRAVAGNLRAQLILTTVAPVAVMLIALTLVSVLALTRLTERLLQDRDAELVQLAARQLAAEWDMSVYLLTQLASAEPLRAENLDEVEDLLQANPALLQRFDEVSITDALGVVLASRGGEVGIRVDAQPYYDRARRLRRPVRSEVHHDANGRSVVTVAVPYYDLAGRFSGAVLGVWDLRGSRLSAPIGSIRVGENGYAFLVDRQGTILCHPEGDLVAATWREHPSVAAVTSGLTGAQTVRWRARDTVVAYAPISMTQFSSSLVADETWDGWGLLTSQLWDDILAPLRPYAAAVVVLLVLAVAIPLVFLGINSRGIVAPLQSLVAQADRVASGDFESRVSIDSGPLEVRELEVAFNTMVVQLRKYRQDIQNYLVSILNSQEQERKRVARELHDDTAQALVVLGRRLELLNDLEGEALHQEMEELRDLVDDSLRGVRSFTRDLRPPLLEELGLPRTLEILGDRIAREEPFQVHVHITGTPRPLLPEVELGLYRLAQESLSNVRRHARASTARVDLIYGDADLCLRITDNGIGFDAPADPAELVNSGRLGLVGIHERARLFGGRAQIASHRGHGSQVTITIPITSILLPQTSEADVRPASDDIPGRSPRGANAASEPGVSRS